MQAFQYTPNRTRQQHFAPLPAFVQRASFERRSQSRTIGLRQVEEFSASLIKLRRSGYLSAFALLLFTFVCIGLFLRDVDVIALYTAGTAVLLVQLAMAGSDYFHEEKRTAQRYWDYLDTYSYEIIAARRHTSHLSAWSRYEIDKYLAVPHITW